MLIAEQTLNNWDHIAEIERIGDTNNIDFHFTVGEGNYRKEHILDYLWASSIHLLDKFPDSLVDDKIILFLFYIVAELVFVVE